MSENGAAPVGFTIHDLDQTDARHLVHELPGLEAAALRIVRAAAGRREALPAAAMHIIGRVGVGVVVCSASRCSREG